jgi:hypothetical protein
MKDAANILKRAASTFVDAICRSAGVSFDLPFRLNPDSFATKPGSFCALISLAGFAPARRPSGPVLLLHYKRNDRMAISGQMKSLYQPHSLTQ